MRDCKLLRRAGGALPVDAGRTRAGGPAMSIMLGLFAAVLALVLFNVPIAVALGVVALVAMVATHGLAILPNLAVVAYNGATSFPLLAIPLFILAGAIMNASGISRRLIAFASALFGWIRGGLAHVSIGSSLFFAEISGSAVADVAALGSILIPGMKAKGYPAPFAAAVMSSAATLAVIIPPSIPMILYAVMAETSVVQLFVAGIVPGLIGGFGLMGDGLRVRAPVQPAARGCVLWARVRSDRARGAVGVPAADHHPGRHLRRRRDGDRGRGARRGRRAVRRPPHLSRAQRRAPARRRSSRARSRRRS